MRPPRQVGTHVTRGSFKGARFVVEPMAKGKWTEPARSPCPAGTLRSKEAGGGGARSGAVLRVEGPAIESARAPGLQVVQAAALTKPLAAVSDEVEAS